MESEFPIGCDVAYRGPDRDYPGTVLGYGRDKQGPYVSVYLDGWDGPEHCRADTLVRIDRVNEEA